MILEDMSRDELIEVVRSLLSERREPLRRITPHAGVARPAQKCHDGRTQTQVGEERGSSRTSGSTRLDRYAQDAIAARDEMLGYVAHEIRNPLSAVALAIGLLTRRPPEVRDDRRRSIPVDNILHALQRMNRIVDDLLDVTRLDGGALALEAVAVDPKVLVRDVLAELTPVAESRGLTLCALIPEDLPAVRCDATRIEQVIANLVGNALKFTPTGGRVTVGAERSGALTARFRVTDSGHGMSQEELPHVFDRFWQGKYTSRGSAGLGLAICRGIVAAHGGEIWVESQREVGTTFFFTIPLAQHDLRREPGSEAC